MMDGTIRFAFFGTPQIGVWVLDELEKEGFTPSLVVTNPDAPKGRKLTLTPSPVSLWARERNIETLKPASLKHEEVITALKDAACDLYIVAAYGKMIPREILALPKYKVLNMHPSLLPKLRGASPIRSAILENMNPTGVSIMVLTEGMDEGPIVAQKEVAIREEEWPLRGRELDELLAKKGGALLAQILPSWIEGTSEAKEQDHSQATYSTKITKDMGLIDLSSDPYENLLKIRAFDGWPGAYFFHQKNGQRIRVKIIDAEIKDGELRITRVVPEGKKEMGFEEFLR